MQSLGRTLRRVGETLERREGAAGRAGVLYSNVPQRSRPPAYAVRAEAFFARLPRRSGFLATVAFLVATVAYGAVVGDRLGEARDGAFRVLGEVTAVGGLGIRNIQIGGAGETSEAEVVEALAIDAAPSLLTFDPFAARKRLMELAWVGDATVQKLYPDTLRVEIVERRPFALWQIGGIVSIVDEEGGAIEELSEPRFASLPLVVGYGANRHAAELMDVVRGHPQLAARFRAAVRVADRRWNVRLDNGVEIKLPEKDMAGAVAELARLDRDEAILSRDLAAVDLRLSDRVVLTLSERAAVQRKAALKERGPARRKGANI